MPDNSLAPPNMPWLWQPNSPVGQPNSLGPPMLNYAAPPNPAAPTVGQGAAQTAADVSQALPRLQAQRAEEQRQGHARSRYRAGGAQRWTQRSSGPRAS